MKDDETNEPVADASVKLMQSDVTNGNAITGINGIYLIKNITPGEYDIQVSKISYGTSTQKIEVKSGKTIECNFNLPPVAVPYYSVDYLDFETDLISLSFTVSNLAKGKFMYVFNPDSTWIHVSPSTGEITDETDTITVTINRSGLSDRIKYHVTIKISSFILQETVVDSIIIYLDGLMDKRDGDIKYYKVVKIGTQIWMAENLDVGNELPASDIQTNNGVIEKYGTSSCWLTSLGGVYTWGEMMQYNPSDDGTIGTTQGICPDGWHIPIEKEWQTLIDYLGGTEVAGGKLKTTGIYSFTCGCCWVSPNPATNESGFDAYPWYFGEYTDPNPNYNWHDEGFGHWWSSTESGLHPDLACFHKLSPYDTRMTTENYSKLAGMSVRCVKNP